VTREGVIKIGRLEPRPPKHSLMWTASQECGRDIDSSPGADLVDFKALGYITMELMQKYVKDDGAIGMEDFDRWPFDSKAVQFLAMITSTTSIQALRKVRSTVTRQLPANISSIPSLHPTGARKS